MIKGIIMTAVIALAMVFPAKHALHMFQQNRYELGRLNKWVKASWRTNAEGAVVPLALTVIGLLAGLLFQGLLQTLIEIAILIFMALYLYADEKKKNYIKPLVYTARVKRQIAVLAVPRASAVSVKDVLVGTRIKAIWNFAHVDLDVPEDIQVENVHLHDSLMKLSYNIRCHDEAKEKSRKR